MQYKPQGHGLDTNKIPKITSFWRCVRLFRENLKTSAKETKYQIDNISSHTPRTYTNKNGCNTNLRGIDLTQIKFQR